LWVHAIANTTTFHIIHLLPSCILSNSSSFFFFKKNVTFA
jgi:hypothetical protein